MSLRIRARRLPGLGYRYELALRGDCHLVVVVQNDGRCQMGVLMADADEPERVVSLEHDQAVAVASLLTGARFSIDTTTDDRVRADEVTVETVTLGPRSPAVGRVAEEVSLPQDGDAMILAVIRGERGELVEEEPIEPFRPGDRVVVSVRRDRAADVAQRLAG